MRYSLSPQASRTQAVTSARSYLAVDGYRCVLLHTLGTGLQCFWYELQCQFLDFQDLQPLYASSRSLLFSWLKCCCLQVDSISYHYIHSSRMRGLHLIDHFSWCCKYISAAPHRLTANIDPTTVHTQLNSNKRLEPRGYSNLWLAEPQTVWETAPCRSDLRVSAAIIAVEHHIVPCHLLG